MVEKLAMAVLVPSSTLMVIRSEAKGALPLIEVVECKSMTIPSRANTDVMANAYALLGGLGGGGGGGDGGGDGGSDGGGDGGRDEGCSGMGGGELHGASPRSEYPPNRKLRPVPFPPLST